MSKRGLLCMVKVKSLYEMDSTVILRVAYSHFSLLTTRGEKLWILTIQKIFTIVQNKIIPSK